MDLQQLYKFADAMLDKWSQTLVNTQSMTPVFHIVSGDPEKNDIILAAPGDIMNSPQAKHAMGGEIRKMIPQVRGVAVLTLMDTWQAVFSGSEEQQIKVGRWMHQNHISVTEAYELGLVKRREALIMTVESPLGLYTVVQFYKRDEKEKVVLEERKSHTDIKAGQANFSGFFSKAKTVDELVEEAKENPKPN
jgi:hypothetical protein